MSTVLRDQNERGPIAWMAGNSVAANLLMLFLLIGGLVMGTRIKQEVFPEFTVDVVTVSVAYPGASPEEVEQGIVLAIEEAVQGLDGVDEVVSSAREGVAVVTIDLLLGADLQKLANDIENEIDRITTFPEESEEPQVEVVSRKRQVVSLVLYGDQTEHTLRNLAEQLRDSLLQDPDITQVELAGVRNLEISIDVAQHQLRRYGLTLAEVAQQVNEASLDLPGGGIKTESGEVLVRMKERRDTGEQFAAIPVISNNDGSVIRLDEIATVSDGFEDSDRSAIYNGKRAVMIEVYRIGDQTPIEVADAVFAQMATWQTKLPPGIEMAVVNDSSDVFKQRADLLLRNAFLGLALVLVLLSIFLEARLAFWVTMGIPVSFLGAFLLLPLAGVSINMVSMFAFIIALGIVVDDAIVVGENIYKFRQQGMAPHRAAIAGVREVAVPVTFSVLTNIVAFMPLYFVPGTMGKIMLTIPVVVVSVFIISLIESLYVLPAHLGHLGDKRRNRPMAWLHERQQRFSAWFTHLVADIYGPFLDKVLHRRYITIALAVTVLMVTTAYVKSGRMGMTMFPKVESDFAQVQLTLPYGSPVASTEAICRQLLAAADVVAQQHGGDTLVVGSFTEIGISGSHTARIRVFLTDAELRPLPTDQFVKLWRQQTGEPVGLESIKFAADAGGPGSGDALTIELSHPDLDTLELASADLAKALSYYPRVTDIDDGFAPGKQQLDFTVRELGRSLGLNARQVALQVRNAYDGAEVLRQQRGRNEIKVVVRLPEAERITEYNLEEMVLRSPNGVEVPLFEAVDVDRGQAYISIDRRRGRRVVTVTADVNPLPQAGQVISALEQDTLPELLERYSGLSYSFEGKQADLQESMTGLAMGLGMALLLIYFLLAIPFRSYIQPTIIMISIPFGIVGAVAGHILMGYSLSIMSLFGVLALSGVVVNDSLVLIDFANRRHKAGDSAHDAVLAAGVQRFRPILLTTLTTFCGLGPMIFETSRQARFLIPMAISLGFGILFATLIALLLVPVLYMVVEDLRGWWSKGHSLDS
ncbi:MAG: efflux RND transporter permease subunit [Desulfuromonas sp.]|nr:efflux RND transporter permease subunit [Desulfuromonas sp.]